MTSSDNAIGIFDSGVGGLTVLRALTRELPGEDTVYYGDTARVPYGPKSAETITRFSLEVLSFLLSCRVKIVVIACNSATSVALSRLREVSSVPVVGVVEPGVRAAIRCTGNQKVGVIGTEATISSGSYRLMLKKLSPEIKIFERACPLFVPLVEEDSGYWIDSPLTRQIVGFYLSGLKRSRIDTLVLGCTHYPLLNQVFSEVVGPDVHLVDSATEVAKEVRLVLEKTGLLRSGQRIPERKYYVSDQIEKFCRSGGRFLGQPVNQVELKRVWEEFKENKRFLRE
ncbi:MAG: glutamate racemase [bacterium]|nr:glutamate racemase [bacterium]